MVYLRFIFLNSYFLAARWLLALAADVVLTNLAFFSKSIVPTTPLPSTYTARARSDEVMLPSLLILHSIASAWLAEKVTMKPEIPPLSYVPTS